MSGRQEGGESLGVGLRRQSGFSVETKGAFFFDLFKMRSSLQVPLAHGSVLAW